MTRLKTSWIGGLLLAQIALGFQFSLVGLPTVELKSPADGSATYMTHPHFRWAEIAQADRYEIQISTNSDWQTLKDSDSIPVPRYVPLGELPAGHDYWWRVRVKLRNGRTGDWSPARKLTVSQPDNLYTISTNDSVATITNIIAIAAANTPAKVVFEPGIYWLNPPDDTYLLEIRNTQNLIIDGSLCEINMINNQSGFSRLTGCTNISLCRFNVDYRTTNGIPTTHTSGRIISTQTNDASMVFQPLDGNLPPDDPRIRDASTRRWGCLMDTNTPGRLKIGASNFFDFKTNVTSLGNGQYRLYLTDSHAPFLNQFAAGDLLVKNAGRGNRIMACTYSADISYESITSYGSSGAFFGGNFNDGTHLLSCRSLIRPGRFNSTAADGFIGAGFRTGYWIENCTTEGLFDDVINCSRAFLNIHSKVDSTTLKLYAASILQAGEHLTLYNPQSGQTNGTFEVVSTVKDPGTNLWTVVLNGDAGTVYPGRENWNSQLFISERAHQYAYIRHNTFRNSRRFGCLICAHDAVIEGNNFIGLGNSAVRGHNECNSFAGGFDNLNLRILNNYIEDCGYTADFLGQDSGAIEFGIAAYGTNCTQTVHRNIEIIGNTIYDWDGKGIRVKNAQDVLILSNTVVNLYATNFYPGGSNYGIYLDYTDGAYVIGNDLRDDRPMTAPVFVTNSVNTVLDGNLLP